MTLPAISVRGLGKMYRISHESKRTDSFREAITSTVLAPFRRLRQLRGTDESMEEFWALKDVSFDVQPGEVVGIIGRNGAGKSTLLKILSRIVEPTAGEIRLRGRVASLLEVGTGFHPELTGRENIYLNGSILGMKKREIDRKFDEIVDFAEVEKFLDTPVKRYSSGMYVRLAFAVAAHLDPEILIVDEVLAVGDAEFQRKCLGKMKEVSTGTGRTVLFVSHNMGAVRSLCNEGILLSNGGIAAAGAIVPVIQKYSQTDDSLANSQLITLQRPCNATYWIESLVLKNSINKSSGIHMGSGIMLELIYRSEYAVNNPKFMLIIGNADNPRLVQFSNRFVVPSLNKTGAVAGKIVIEITTLHLCAGKYNISLHVGDIGAIQQVANDVASITVEPNDVFESGRIPHISDGPIWLPSKWAMTEEMELATTISETRPQQCSDQNT